MKKAICIFAAIIFALALAACGGEVADNSAQDQSSRVEAASDASAADPGTEPEETSEDVYYLLYKKTESNNGNNKTTVYDYDLSGRPVREDISSGNKKSFREYTYDDNGDISTEHYKSSDLEVTDVYEYDEHGQVVKVYSLENPDNYILREYSEDGKVVKVCTYQGGNLAYDIIYDYNDDGTYTATSVGEKFGRQVGTYNKDGKPTEITSDSISRWYDYDERGNETKITTESNGTKNTVEYSYEYTDDGLIAKKGSLQNGAEFETVYEYDGQGNLLTETTKNGMGVTTLKIEYEYKYFPKG